MQWIGGQQILSLVTLLCLVRCPDLATQCAASVNCLDCLNVAAAGMTKLSRTSTCADRHPKWIEDGLLCIGVAEHHCLLSHTDCAGLNVVHMTACNISGRIRLSCDTRWQPAADPCDPCLSVWHTKQDAMNALQQ